MSVMPQAMPSGPQAAPVRWPSSSTPVMGLPPVKGWRQALGVLALPYPDRLSPYLT